MQILDLQKLGTSDLPALFGADTEAKREPIDLYRRIVDGVAPETPPWLEHMGECGKAYEQPTAQLLLRLKLKEEAILSQPQSRVVGDFRYSLDFVSGLFPKVGGWIVQDNVPQRKIEVKMRSQDSAEQQGFGEERTAEVSEAVMLQVQGQMALAKLDRNYWRGSEIPDIDETHIAVGINGQRVQHYIVPYNAKMAELILEEMRRFWTDHVAKKVPPPLLYKEGTRRELRRMYPVAGEKDDLIEAPEDADAIARRVLFLMKVEKDAQKQIEEEKLRLLEVIGGHYGMQPLDQSWKAIAYNNPGRLSWGEFLKEIEAHMVAGTLNREVWAELHAKHTGEGGRVVRVYGSKKA